MSFQQNNETNKSVIYSLFQIHSSSTKIHFCSFYTCPRQIAGFGAREKLLSFNPALGQQKAEDNEKYTQHFGFYENVNEDQTVMQFLITEVLKLYCHIC